MPRAALDPDGIAAFRARLADAATKLFAAHGYEAVTMRAVADALGVSAMTPYRYLAGKDELIALVRTAAFRRFAEALERATGRVADPEDRLRVLKRAYLKFAADHGDEYRIMFELRGGDDGKRWPELAREAARAFGILVDAVRAAVEAKVIEGDPLTIAHLLWAGAHGLASLHLAGRLEGRSLQRLSSIEHELAGFRRRT
jgi:AcrR family transcriptional regulator